MRVRLPKGRPRNHDKLDKMINPIRKVVYCHTAGTFHQYIAYSRYDADKVIAGMLVPGKGLSEHWTINPKPFGSLLGSTVVLTLPKPIGRVNAAWLAWCATVEDPPEQFMLNDGSYRGPWFQHLMFHAEGVPRSTRFRHLDGNPWNNRRDNLAIVERKPHRAITRIGGIVVSLGSYGTKDEALRACNDARQAVGHGPVKTRNRNPESKP